MPPFTQLMAKLASMPDDFFPDLMVSRYCSSTGNKLPQHEKCTNIQCLCKCHEGGSGVREPRRPDPSPLVLEEELVDVSSAK